MSGLLSRLRARRTASPLVVHATVYPGNETLEVVGESRYQEALWEIAGGFRDDPVRRPVDAVLLPEPDNEYDSNAIQVIVNGRLVGYLSRDDAALYLPGLLRLMERTETGHVALEGHVVGGGSGTGRIGSLGVFLDHSPADFGLAPHHTTGGSLRTGLSEALATDLDDDTYDLSWLGQLSADDYASTSQLRSLLEEERDPIDRHFMLCELEARLYRCRDSRESALEEFDEICDRHHEEMAAIRPALLTKFGVVPLIEFYRQASIRCQKAKHWETARGWAERGIEIYGTQAARPEAVDDLRKRAAHAAAKMEATDRAKERKPRAVSVPAGPRELETETLVCSSCGATFERVRTRGRKPKLCPTCRGSTIPVASP